MSWLEGILVYCMLWWIILFTVLSWGNKREEHQDPRYDSGAPLSPRLGYKFLATTAIAALFWLVIDIMVRHEGLSFRSHHGQIF